MLLSVSNVIHMVIWSYDVIIWSKCYHVGRIFIIWDEMLLSGANIIIWSKCYHVGRNDSMWILVANAVILPILCCTVPSKNILLSTGVIMWRYDM
jgi:hypothetical protein